MSAAAITPDWIAVDRGADRLRVWAMQGATRLAQVQADADINPHAPNGFDQILRAATAGWTIAAGTPVVACGIAQSPQGRAEAPFRAVPCAPLGDPGAVAPTAGGWRVRIIPGLSQSTPPDVMQGDETRIAGFMSLNPGWDGVVCLPGTHSRWAHVSAGEVVSFQTFMTGELLALLATQSVLRTTVTGGDAGAETDAFDSGLAEAMARPERLAARLFGLHAADLLEGTRADAARSRLSGLLIGAELGAAKPYWLGQDIAILGAAEPARLYARALRTQGVPATVADPDRMTLAGLTAAYRAMTPAT